MLVMLRYARRREGKQHLLLSVRRPTSSLQVLFTSHAYQKDSTLPRVTSTSHVLFRHRNAVTAVASAVLPAFSPINRAATTIRLTAVGPDHPRHKQPASPPRVSKGHLSSQLFALLAEIDEMSLTKCQGQGRWNQRKRVLQRASSHSLTSGRAAITVLSRPSFYAKPSDRYLYGETTADMLLFTASRGHPARVSRQVAATSLHLNSPLHTNINAKWCGLYNIFWSQLFLYGLVSGL
ncbi:hypothetical protein K504DRAFT_503216 [Pleomassaria siparia CBS 279.74]|uniref:Uncharacterized protein n=1 Tax=Pleomassaria siparia CBS 279.74 TaxID=1314801 RepID=A0A6G1K6M4_9PLEO|nr:hypothetical protein K504DRAFT_503216 [Pleomassaria siparia CBS 279.74]